MFEVFPDNWEALELFLSCGTQWRFAPGGSPTGIDYPSLDAVMRIRATQRRAERFAQVRLIESGALTILNRKR